MINVLVIARLIVTLLPSHRTIEDGVIAVHGGLIGMEAERMLGRTGLSHLLATPESFWGDRYDRPAYAGPHGTQRPTAGR